MNAITHRNSAESGSHKPKIYNCRLTDNAAKRSHLPGNVEVSRLVIDQLPDELRVL